MWVHRYAEEYRERICKGKMSTERIATMTGLPPSHAKALARFCRSGEAPPKELPDPGSFVESDKTGVSSDPSGPDKFFHSTNYVYNAETDTYITFLPDLPKPIVLSGQTHREIVRAYSNFDGSPATINEVARAVKMPRNWLVKYLKAHEITHDREPFTVEELTTRTDDELVEDALQLRRSVLYKKLEKAKWADIQEDALKWRSFHEYTLRAMTAALQSRPAVDIPRINIGPPLYPYAAVVGLTDLHLGKYSDPQENFESYNRNLARERLFDCTSDVLGRLCLFGAPDKFFVPIGSDFMHIDNDQGTTTLGTNQDMDGTPAEILVSACQLMEDWILMLRQAGPVDLVLMSGNHDQMSGLAVLMYLEALFRKDPDVTVSLDRTPRVYRAYGKNLLGFAHGEVVSKTQDLAGLMAREAGDLWSGCPKRTIYTGHIHSEKTETDVSFGVTRRQIPSLSGPDRWHARHGFLGAPKSLPLYLHDKNRGLVAVLHSPVGG